MSEKEGGAVVDSTAGSVFRSDHGVWMMSDGNMISVSRRIAEMVLSATGGNPNDWRSRDRIIIAIADFVDSTLDEVSPNAGAVSPADQKKEGSK